MSTPVAVLISDIHYSLSTLELADKSLRMAIDKAAELDIPLIVAGDLNDTKAIIRGEVANALINTMWHAKHKNVQVVVIVGNHDLLNEKASAHSLRFLEPYAEIVDGYKLIGTLYCIAYHNSLEELKEILSDVPSGSTLIMHQGVQTAFLGHYVQDQTSLPPETFADFRVVSGHYHRAQDIKCGRPRKGAVGLFSYIGSPYSTSFAEAKDGPKGFQILGSDGLLTQVPTNLRKHVILELDFKGDRTSQDQLLPNPGDLVWVKYTGTAAELATINKKEIGERLGIGQNFKLDLIKTDRVELEAKTEGMADEAVLDALIDSTGESESQKAYLKRLWKEELA